MKEEPFVLIVDDEEGNRKLLSRIIRTQGSYRIEEAKSGILALEKVKEDPPDLILMDVMMEDMDGFATAKALKAQPETANIPVIFITGLNDLQEKIKGFNIGGVDYITKPFDIEEVISRVNTHIKLKRLVDNLEEEVRQRTQELERLNLVLVSALENANFFNDDDTGNHIKRVSHYSQILATALGLDSRLVNEIYRYASLHDIGKVGIPDTILKKPGKLEPEEWRIMKTHSEIGFKMINFPEFSLLAKNIVLYHHERWDGSGYPQGLSKENIPIEARVVAMADVYDALRSRRPYKEPFTAAKAHDIIMESAGSHFDPKVAEIFEKNHPEFEAVFSELRD